MTRVLPLWLLVLAAFGVWLWMLGQGGALARFAVLAAVLLAVGVTAAVAVTEREGRRQRK